MGNWRAMFEPDRAMKQTGTAPPQAQAETPRELPPDDDGLAFDLSAYKPWILQRGRSRPAMMLHLRRFETKSGLWMGWQLSYPHLIAAEYVGDRMLSLDFGTRQFVIEGTGLGELARYLQSGSVVMVQEYSDQAWVSHGDDKVVTGIRKIT